MPPANGRAAEVRTRRESEDILIGGAEHSRCPSTQPGYTVNSSAPDNFDRSRLLIIDTQLHTIPAEGQCCAPLFLQFHDLFSPIEVCVELNATIGIYCSLPSLGFFWRARGPT
uniref:Uncharacterized protein n=1 Tax=Anthurium amnicola TaxID=1678845 RepID=A0A1D1YLE6_9ARAE